jgi:antirestriction protein ArdC
MRNLFSNEGNKAVKTDIYQRVTDKIIASLETGIRPWLKPWSGEHAAGRITRPLRGNGVPYQGINVLMLWGAAMEKGYSAPIWMTFKQALELGGAVRKGERGSLVVYASTFSRTDPSPGALAKGEADESTGEESERDIPFLKGYTVFNVEQIDGLPAHFLAPAEPRIDPVQRIEHAERFFAATGATVRHGGGRLSTASVPIMCRCRILKPSGTRKAITPPLRMNSPTGLATRPALPVNSDASVSGMKATPWRNSLPNLARPSCPPTSI